MAWKLEVDPFTWVNWADMDRQVPADGKSTCLKGQELLTPYLENSDHSRQSRKLPGPEEAKNWLRASRSLQALEEKCGENRSKT